MSTDYDTCKENLKKLVVWYEANRGDRNEATTRFHLIDRLLFECLGWQKEDAVLEDSYGREYTDYTLSAPRPLLIVEAKKEGTYFELPVGPPKTERSIANLCADNKGLRAAMEQVAHYSQTRGVPFAMVSNGDQLVAFYATRSDGIKPFDGRALVFGSLESMEEAFLKLWNSLSRTAIEQQKLRRLLVGDGSVELPPKLSALIPGYPGVKARNTFQADLQTLGELTIEDIPSSEELIDKFLSECYVQSGSLSQYSLISKSILNARYSSLFAPEVSGPVPTNVFQKKGELSPELIAKSFGKRPILLLGDVGAGKTTFINYLIRVDAAPLFENCITFLLNLGSKGVLAENLKSFIVDEIADQLLKKYNIDIYARNFIAGTYYGDLERFRNTGLFAELRETDPTTFKIKEIEFLNSKLESREQHIKEALQHISKSRKKQIVVFLDNIDQRDETAQQEVFLISQEMAENWFPVTVFVSLRPETFYRSSRIGAISGYHPKAFTILPPRIDSVVNKRLRFAKSVASGGGFLQNVVGVQVGLATLTDLLTVLIGSLETNKALAECIENMAGGNVRLALDIVRGFLGSGHVDTQKILDIYKDTKNYTIPLHEFLRALIFGDAEYFISEQSPVANLFDVSSLDGREHFIVPLLLGCLESFSQHESEDGFVETSRVYESIQMLGFTPEQIDGALTKAFRKKLLESAAGRIPQPGVQMPKRIRINSIGAYHIHRLCELFTYVDAMIVDTPILDSVVRSEIKNEVAILNRLERADAFRRYLDNAWEPLRQVAAVNLFDWPNRSHQLRQEIARISSSIQSPLNLDAEANIF